MKSKKIGLASDHAGYELKTKIIRFLEDEGYDITDFGAYSEESADYPDFAHPLAKAVENGEFKLGIALCGSGNGINMTLNKYQKIRSALCWTPEIAMMAKLHNDANICSLPARYISEDVAKEIVSIFLKTEFEGGRHQRRIDKISI
jgi:ribose 5-phosphate isomerase B